MNKQEEKVDHVVVVEQEPNFDAASKVVESWSVARVRRIGKKPILVCDYRSRYGFVSLQVT